MNISFLIGAGFSNPTGYLLASEINGRFINQKVEDISVHTDGSAWFNNGIIGPKDWMDKSKVQKFYRNRIGHIPLVEYAIYCRVYGSMGNFKQ